MEEKNRKEPKITRKLIQYSILRIIKKERKSLKNQQNLNVVMALKAQTPTPNP